MIDDHFPSSIRFNIRFSFVALLVLELKVGEIFRFSYENHEMNTDKSFDDLKIFSVPRRAHLDWSSPQKATNIAAYVTSF